MNYQNYILPNKKHQYLKYYCLNKALNETESSMEGHLKLRLLSLQFIKNYEIF